MRTFTIVILTGVLLTPLAAQPPAAQPPAAQPPAAQPPAKDRETVQCSLLVVNSAGQPVEGAEVRPYAMRAAKNLGAHYLWSETVHGKITPGKTDAEGRYTLDVPRFVREAIEISKISVIVDHPDYVTFTGDKSVQAKPAKIELKDGYRIAATAIDADGKAVNADLFGMMSGFGWTAKEWNLTKRGVLVSRVLDHDRATLRLIHLPNGKPARFSKLIAVERPEQEDRAFVRNVVLEPGVRLEGTLDPTVPRPIKNGLVLCHIAAPDKALRPENPFNKVWHWQDQTNVDADGNFVFPSLPKGDIAQLIVICDGYLSEDPPVEAMKLAWPWHPPVQGGRVAMPQLVILGDTVTKTTVPMEKTATCEVLVTTSEGNPLEGATVSMWPNQRWLLGGSTILGNGYRTIDLLQGKALPQIFPNSNFQAKTDKQGLARIHGLPGKLGMGIGAHHEQHEMPVLGFQRATVANLKPGKTERITIKMQPKGTDVIGRE